MKKYLFYSHPEAYIDELVKDFESLGSCDNIFNRI